MKMPAKLLTILLVSGAAILAFAACNFITPPTLGQPGSENPAPTSAPAAGAAPPTAMPATAIPATGASQPAASGTGGAGSSVMVVGGRSIKQWSSPPQRVIDPSASYTAVLTTSAGQITIELLANEAPNTVNNFVFLAREGFYDNVIFHRTIPDFMIQGGDPTGTGGGGPGYRFADEPVQRPYSRGVMAMANAGPNTNGSQFFLMHADYALPPSYTIFGHTVAGLETIDAIATAPTKPGGEGSSPENPVVIQSVEIIGP